VCYDLQKHVRAVHGKDIDWEEAIPSRPYSEGIGGSYKVTGIKTVCLSSFLASFTGNSESLPGSLLEDADGESKATNINVKQM
jgi:hypothetical protein